MFAADAWPLGDVIVTDISRTNLSACTEALDTLRPVEISVTANFDDDALSELMDQTAGQEVFRLDLSDSAVSDLGLKKLTKAPRLHQLVLDGTAISDAAVMTLCQLRGVRSMYLRRCQLSDTGIRALQEAMPDTDFLHEEKGIGLDSRRRPVSNRRTSQP